MTHDLYEQQLESEDQHMLGMNVTVIGIDYSVCSPICFPHGLIPGLENCIERFLKTVSNSFSRTPKLLLLAGLPGSASVA